MKEITKALGQIQAELKAPKDAYNAFAKFNYRSAESILEAVKPLLHKHEAILLLSDEIREVGGRIYIQATATFKIGAEEIKVTAWAREEESKKGMDSAQVTGSTSSYARKYSLNGLFCIDDTKDADSMDNASSSSGTTKKPPSTPSGPSLQTVIDSIEAQENLSDLEAKMVKAETTSHKGNPQLLAAYNKRKEELELIPY